VDYPNGHHVLTIAIEGQVPFFNPLNAKFNPICRLLALLGTYHILHVSGLRDNTLLFSDAIFLLLYLLLEIYGIKNAAHFNIFAEEHGLRNCIS
jgi:hypothetical protein